MPYSRERGPRGNEDFQENELRKKQQTEKCFELSVGGLMEKFGGNIEGLQNFIERKTAIANDESQKTRLRELAEGEVKEAQEAYRRLKSLKGTEEVSGEKE